MRGYTKTTTLGNEHCLILGPREGYCRETNLPLNWRKCTIGLYLSVVDGVDDDGQCASATLPYDNALNHFSIGISNGVGAPGQAGNRFVGIGRSPVSAQIPTLAGSDSYPFGSTAYYTQMIGDGAALTTVAGGILTDSHKTGTSAFAMFLRTDITLTDTTATVRIARSGSKTDVSTGALINDIMSVGSMLWTGSVTGGWWNGSQVGIRHLFIRAPYSLARLRLHNIRVIQLG